MTPSTPRLMAALALWLALSVPVLAAKVVLIDIDEKTESVFGPFGGFYRERHAELIRRLNQSHVRGIVFMMYFGENPAVKKGSAALKEAAGGSAAPVFIPHGIDEAAKEAIVTDSELKDLSFGHIRTLDGELKLKGMLPGNIYIPYSNDFGQWIGAEALDKTHAIGAAELTRVSQDLSFDGTSAKVTYLVIPKGKPEEIKRISYSSMFDGSQPGAELAGAYVVVASRLHGGKLLPKETIADCDATIWGMQALLQASNPAQAPKTAPPAQKTPILNLSAPSFE